MAFSNDLKTHQLPIAASIRAAIAIPDDDKFTSTPEWLASSILRGLEEYLNTYPALPAQVYDTSHRKYQSFLFQLLGCDRRDASHLGLALANGMAEIAARTYYAHPEVIRRKESWAKSKRGSSSEDLASFLMVTKSQFGLLELTEASTVSGGLSGALVLRAYYRSPEHSSPQLCILKSIEEIDEFNREKAGSEKAAISWMKNWVVKSVKADEVTGIRGRSRFVILSPLAFPPTDVSQHVPSLAEFIERRNIGVCNQVVAKIGLEYGTFFRGLPNEFCKPKQFVEQLLGAWSGKYDGADWRDPEFWALSGLPACSDMCFQDGRDVIWNPLFLLSDLSWLPDENWHFRFGEQHGDLNARNVLVAVDQAAAVDLRVIDFEKWCSSCCFLDVCWLACYILQAAAPIRPTSEHWSELSNIFVEAVKSPDKVPEHDVGSFQFGIDLVRKMFHSVVPAESERVLRNSTNRMLAITLGVVALMQAYYETRALDRHSAFASNDNRRYRRLWALHFFRVASRALGPLCQKEHVPATADLNSTVAKLFS